MMGPCFLLLAIASAPRQPQPQPRTPPSPRRGGWCLRVKKSACILRAACPLGGARPPTAKICHAKGVRRRGFPGRDVFIQRRARRAGLRKPVGHDDVAAGAVGVRGLRRLGPGRRVRHRGGPQVSEWRGWGVEWRDVVVERSEVSGRAQKAKTDYCCCCCCCCYCCCRCRCRCCCRWRCCCYCCCCCCCCRYYDYYYQNYHYHCN